MESGNYLDFLHSAQRLAESCEAGTVVRDAFLVFLVGRIHMIRLLESIPQGLLELLQCTLSRHGRKFQVSFVTMT